MFNFGFSLLPLKKKDERNTLFDQTHMHTCDPLVKNTIREKPGFYRKYWVSQRYVSEESSLWDDLLHRLGSSYKSFEKS